MDSSQGIPVEYKLDAFNMLCTGTTLCHPKISYVDPMRNPALDTYLSTHLWATLMETMQTLHQRHETTRVTLKFNPLTRPTTHAAISTFSTSHNAILSPYSYSPRVLQHQKQTQYPMLQNKTIHKNTFRLSPSYFFILPLIPNYN